MKKIDGLVYYGGLSKYITRGLFGAAKSAGKMVMGVGEGLVGGRTGLAQRSPSAGVGRAIGAGARHAGIGAAKATASIAPVAGRMLYHQAEETGRIVAGAGRGVVNTFTRKDQQGRRLMNLWTGREWRPSTGAVAGALPLAVAVGSGGRAMRDQNLYGNVYGNPSYPNDPPSLGYDGMNASGDLTLALSRNRHG